MSYGAIALGVGTMMKYYGQTKADQAEAASSEKNASYYREQADYARKTGERDQMIFDRESVVLHGDQVSAFAKNGVDVTAGAGFIAQQMFYRQNESEAIKAEADFNVRLAMLKADQAQGNADYLNSSERKWTNFLGGALSMGGSMV